MAAPMDISTPLVNPPAGVTLSAGISGGGNSAFAGPDMQRNQGYSEIVSTPGLITHVDEIKSQKENTISKDESQLENSVATPIYGSYKKVLEIAGSDANYMGNPAGISIGIDGNLIVTTYRDVATNNHRIQRYTPNGLFRSYFGSRGNGNGQFEYPYGNTVNPSNGDIYVADLNNHRIQYFSSTGVYKGQWPVYIFHPVTSQQFNGNPCDIAVSSDGFVYVLTDYPAEQVIKYSLTGSNELARWGNEYGAYGSSANGKFDGACGIAVNRNGYVYVADGDNYRIQKFSPSGAYISQTVLTRETTSEVNTAGTPLAYAVDFSPSGDMFVAGNNYLYRYSSSGVLTEFWDPERGNTYGGRVDIAVDNAGNVYETGSYGYVIKYSKPAPTPTPTPTQTPTPTPTTTPTPTPTPSISYQFVINWGYAGYQAGQFNNPSGITVDSAANVFVADAYNARVQKFTSSGTFINQIGGAWGSANGLFKTPYGIAVDTSGNVYVSDWDNHRIQKFTNTGTFITKWGTQGTSNGQFNNPKGVATDSAGNVYVADFSNHRIQEFSSTGAFITKWGTQGTSNGQFNKPNYIAVDKNGYVYVTDRDNHRIQKFTNTGTFITKWGAYGTGNSQFVYPQGVAVDSAGNVYVAEFNRVQKFTSSGTFITKWGTQGTGNGEFRSPEGIVVDSAGNVYVADTSNQRIQKFKPSSVQTGSADNIGVVRGKTWSVDYNGNGYWNSGDKTANFGVGDGQDKPVTGDWNGNGKTNIGVVRGNKWYVDLNGNGYWDSSDKSATFGVGDGQDKPVTGDWNGNGKTNIGVVRGNKWYVDYNGNGYWDSGDKTATFGGGDGKDIPVTGDWSGNGKTNIGVVRGNKWYVDFNGNGYWDPSDKTATFGVGDGKDIPVVGKWSGTGVASVEANQVQEPERLIQPPMVTRPESDIPRVEMPVKSSPVISPMSGGGVVLPQNPLVNGGGVQLPGRTV
jgi:DNA-binding beta-propeller fold protein YncE